MSAADSDPSRALSAVVKRILVVDADESVAAAARKLVAAHPCHVDWAKDDSEASRMIEASRAEPYDVIFVELRHITSSKSALLPLLSPAEPRLPIIATVPLGYDAGVSLVKARSLGVPLFLYTPFMAKHFFRVIERLIPTPQ